MNALPSRRDTSIDTQAKPPQGQSWPATYAVTGSRDRAPDTDAFGEYLWSSRQPPPLLFRTQGCAQVRGLDDPPTRIDVAPSAPPPAGVIHIYPRYLAFAGHAAGVEASLPGLTPPALGSEAMARLPAPERRRLRERLRSATSVILAIGEIKGVRAGRWRGMPCIEVVSPSQLLLLGPDPALIGSACASLASASTRWEPRMQALLRELLA